MQKKGFTLAELLGVIVIIGLLLLLIIPLIINGVKNREDDVEQTQNNIIFEAVGEYLDLDEDKYPSVPGNIYCVSLQDLIDAGKLVDPVKKIVEEGNYDTNFTIEVIISKEGTRKYSVADGECKPYTSKDIEFLIKPGNNKWSKEKTVTIFYPEECGTDFICTYKKDNNAEQTVTSGKTATITFNQNGQIKANMKGKSEIEKTTKVEKIDTQKPKLVKVELKEWNYDSQQRIDLTMTDAHSGVGGYCFSHSPTKPTDPNDSCFTNVRFPAYGGTGTITKYLNVGQWYIYIKDRVGNIRGYDDNDLTADEKAKFTFKVEDNDPPTVSFNPNSKDWSKTADVTVTLNDPKSGLKANQNIYYAWSTSNTQQPSYSSYVKATNVKGAKQTTVKVSASNLNGTYYLWIKSGIEDLIGNKSVATKSGAFKFDNTKPTCNLKLSASPSSSGWYTTSNLSVILTTSDAHSKVKSSVVKDTIGNTYGGNGTTSATIVVPDSNGITYSATITDNVGNVQTCSSGSIKKDSTPPTITDKGNVDVGSVSGVKASDDLSGIGSYKYAFVTQKKAPSVNSSKWIDDRNGGPKDCTSTIYVYVKVTDKAGNATIKYLGSYECCSKSNYKGCPQMQTCRSSAPDQLDTSSMTHLHSTTKSCSSDGVQCKQVYTPTTVYIISESGSYYYVRIKAGDSFKWAGSNSNYPGGNDNYYGYIYSTCLMKNVNSSNFCVHPTCPG